MRVYTATRGLNPPESMITRILVAALFALFAYFQLNDPDPWAWVIYYASLAIAYAVSVKWIIPQWVKYTGLAVSLIWLLTLLPDFIHWVQMGMPTITGSMKAEAPHIELTREFLGLGIGSAGWWFLRK